MILADQYLLGLDLHHGDGLLTRRFANWRAALFIRHKSLVEYRMNKHTMDPGAHLQVANLVYRVH